MGNKLRNIIKEEINRPSEKEFNDAIKDIMELIPIISHNIIHKNNLSHDDETVIRLNKEILEKVKEGDDIILDQMWKHSWSLILKNAINTITYYTK